MPVDMEYRVYSHSYKLILENNQGWNVGNLVYEPGARFKAIGSTRDYGEFSISMDGFLFWFNFHFHYLDDESIKLKYQWFSSVLVNRDFNLNYKRKTLRNNYGIVSNYREISSKKFEFLPNITSYSLVLYDKKFLPLSFSLIAVDIYMRSMRLVMGAN